MNYNQMKQKIAQVWAMLYRHRHFQLSTFNFQLPCMLLLLTAATACTAEYQTPDVPGGMVDVRFTLNISNVSATRATSEATAGECEVSDINILIFEDSDDATGKLLETPRVLSRTDDSSTNSITLTTRAPEDTKCRIVVLANANAILKTVTLTLHETTQKDVIAALNTQGHYSLPWNLSGTPIPMHGEASADIKTDPISLDIDLYRMLAKVEIVNSATSNFALTAVYHCNYTASGLVMTDLSKMTDQEPHLPATVSTTARTDYTSPTTPFYIFENAAVTLIPASDDWNTAHCLVLAGKYKGSAKETYYRVDFTDDSGNAVPILRNHHYQITIDVHTAGRITLDDALKQVETTGNMTITNWTTGAQVDFWDKSPQYSITINGGAAVFIGTASGASRTVTVTCSNTAEKWRATTSGSLTVSPTTEQTGTQSIKITTTNSGTAGATAGQVIITTSTGRGVTVRFDVIR